MNDPWFKNGLKFQCTGCGKCCCGADGYVFLSQQDLKNLAEHFKMSEQEFTDRYTRIVENQLCLIDAPDTDHCVFLKDHKCSAYSARPVQCQTFPWWIYHLENPENWKSAAAHCEGINHPDAPNVPCTQIAVECMRYIDNLVD